MRLVVLFLFSFIGCGAAQAAIYEYYFETELTECVDFSYCSQDGPPPFWGDPEVPRTVSGSIVLDDRRVPGGSLAGATLSLFQDPLDELAWNGRYWYEAATQSYEVSGLGGLSTDTWQDRFDGWRKADFLVDYSGYPGNFLTWTVGPSELTLSFDDELNVVSWYGSSYDCGDVGCDSHFRGGLGYEDFYTREYGAVGRMSPTWTREFVGPSPVPLPAGAGLLAGALGLLTAVRRRVA